MVYENKRLIVGVPGSGKTYKVMEEIRDISKNNSNDIVVALSIKEKEYEQLVRELNGSCIEVSNNDQLTQLAEVNIEDYKGKVLLISFIEDRFQDNIKLFAQAIKVIVEKTETLSIEEQKKIHLYIEEAHMFTGHGCLDKNIGFELLSSEILNANITLTTQTLNGTLEFIEREMQSISYLFLRLGGHEQKLLRKLNIPYKAIDLIQRLDRGESCVVNNEGISLFLNK